MLMDAAEADDAAQEVFVKAFASLRQYKKDLSFSAWLYRIASNTCLDLLRKRKRQKTDSLDSLVDQHGDHFDGLAPKIGEQAGSVFEKQESLTTALKILSGLSPEQRQILILREVDGLSYDQIGSILRCSLDAVKARLRRARVELQQRARHYFEESSFIK
jgi:RNA polymerase sigma-70 factor (ECF subfamily)